jgi:hypothetical protein
MNRFVKLFCLLGLLLYPASYALAWCSGGCACCRCPGEAQCLGSYSSCEAACGLVSEPSRGGSAPSYDYGAAQRAQEAAAAAEAERQRQAEAERIERERLAEEKRQKDAAFIRDRDAAANSLKGSTGTNTTQLKGLSGSDNYGLKGSGTDPGAQLKSVERHSRDAQDEASRRKGTARETARQGFDTPGRASGNLVYPDKKQQQKPPTALDRRVPAAAQKDAQVQQSLAWYRKLDAQKAEKEKMIAEIKEQKKTSKDPVLDAKIATLNNDVKIITGDQSKVTETVEKRVKNLGFNLVEVAEPTTTEANKK